MKKIFIAVFVLMSSNLVAQEKDNSEAKPIIDTTKFSFDVDSTGEKYYYKIDSLGEKLYYHTNLGAEFNGGELGWRKFIFFNLNVIQVKENLKRKDYKDKQYKQTVELAFIVCKDGSLCNFEVINDVLPAAKLAALNMIKRSPKWIPAKLNGENIKTYKIQKLGILINQD